MLAAAGSVVRFGPAMVESTGPGSGRRGSTFDHRQASREMGLIRDRNPAYREVVQGPRRTGPPQ